MTVFLMAARCLAWIDMNGRRYSCDQPDDHSGSHTVTIDGRPYGQTVLWSNR